MIALYLARYIYIGQPLETLGGLCIEAGGQT
jgi:hypothetical protein